MKLSTINSANTVTWSDSVSHIGGAIEAVGRYRVNSEWFKAWLFKPGTEVSTSFTTYSAKLESESDIKQPTTFSFNRFERCGDALNVRVDQSMFWLAFRDKYVDVCYDGPKIVRNEIDCITEVVDSANCRLEVVHHKYSLDVYVSMQALIEISQKTEINAQLKNHIRHKIVSWVIPSSYISEYSLQSSLEKISDHIYELVQQFKQVVDVLLV